MAVFGAIVGLGLAMMIAALIIGGTAAFPLATFGVLSASTAATFLAIVWMTRTPVIAERTIVQLSGDERRCRIVSDGEGWTLPVGVGKLRVGQKIRVSFREIAPESDIEPGREVIEVRAVEE